MLRRVLLGFARWNKTVGYCQGLNVLAALILQVMDRAEASAVKVMIYLIEGVLPEGYFADNLRGLSIDMAVFRDLLRAKLPKLSRHLEALQHDDKATGLCCVLHFSSLRVKLYCHIIKNYIYIYACRQQLRATIDKRLHHAVVLDAVLPLPAAGRRVESLGFDISRG